MKSLTLLALLLILTSSAYSNTFCSRQTEINDQINAIENLLYMIDGNVLPKDVLEEMNQSIDLIFGILQDTINKNDTGTDVDKAKEGQKLLISLKASVWSAFVSEVQRDLDAFKEFMIANCVSNS